MPMIKLSMSDPNAASRRGSALAIGVLPLNLLASKWKVVLSMLCSSCAIEENPEDRDAEARVNAVRGVVSVCETLTGPAAFPGCFSEEEYFSLLFFVKNKVMHCLFEALNDYSVDNRGDVGSWVREAALNGLEKCTYILCQSDSRGYSISDEVANDDASTFFDDKLAVTLVGGIVKQAVEKMDKIREIAAKVLQRVLYNKTFIVHSIPHRDKLEEIIPSKGNTEWGVPAFSYPRFVQLLQFNCYSKYVVSGLVISVGGLLDSLRKASLTALLEYLQDSDTGKHEPNTKESILSTDVLWVLQQYKRCDRVVVPTLKTIEILFSKKVFLEMEDQTSVFCAGLLDCLTVELKATKDFSKLYAGIAILGYIASLSDSIRSRAFASLLTFLGHRYPKIRKAGAEQVYLVLLQSGDGGDLIPGDEMEKALETVSETCWEGDAEEAKSRRLELFNMAGLDYTQSIKGSHQISNQEKKPANNKSDENASYSSLVDSAGF